METLVISEKLEDDSASIRTGSSAIAIHRVRLEAICEISAGTNNGFSRELDRKVSMDADREISVEFDINVSIDFDISVSTDSKQVLDVVAGRGAEAKTIEEFASGDTKEVETFTEVAGCELVFASRPKSCFMADGAPELIMTEKDDVTEPILIDESTTELEIEDTLKWDDTLIARPLSTADNGISTENVFVAACEMMSVEECDDNDRGAKVETNDNIAVAVFAIEELGLNIQLKMRMVLSNDQTKIKTGRRRILRQTTHAQHNVKNNPLIYMRRLSERSCFSMNLTICFDLRSKSLNCP